MIVVAAATKRVGVGGMVEKIWVVVVVGRIIMYNIGGSAINEGVHRFVECVCVYVYIAGHVQNRGRPSGAKNPSARGTYEGREEGSSTSRPEAPGNL